VSTTHTHIFPINQTDLATRLANSEAFSDCKVNCGTYSFNLHKTVLGSQSDYFLKAFDNETFKV
jgi:hypothetical protein